MDRIVGGEFVVCGGSWGFLGFVESVFLVFFGLGGVWGWGVDGFCVLGEVSVWCVIDCVIFVCRWS